MHTKVSAPLVLLAATVALTGCGSGGDTELPLDIDYSDPKLAESRNAPLQGNKPEAVSNALRNGIRLSLVAQPIQPALTPMSVVGDETSGGYSRTIVQVDGVDESDAVNYDGRHMFTVRQEPAPFDPGMTRNALTIGRTDPLKATVEIVNEYHIPGDQSVSPFMYALLDDDGTAEFIAVVSQDYSGWTGFPASLVIAPPDLTRVQLLDVRDPANVSQAWELEFQGWIRGTRKIGNTLYVVSSHRPRLPDLIVPADTVRQREANERRILNARSAELLPTVRVNGGSAHALVAASDCVVPADLADNEAFMDLLVITSIDLESGALRDVACLSTNVNGLYVSRETLYVGGERAFADASATILHKFALHSAEIGYRATGQIMGSLPWQNPAYYMDEFENRLRVMSTEATPTGPEHRLTVLEERPGGVLTAIATLPNAQRPERIGKPGEQLHATRFAHDRAYVVTARVLDPLYVIDLNDPSEPFIAGEVDMPGTLTQLLPIELDGRKGLLAVGTHTLPNGTHDGVKVELFDVEDVAQPTSLGAYIIGNTGTASEAAYDPHALAVLHVSSSTRYRVGFPIDVFDDYTWQFSGFQFFEVNTSGTPTLALHGALITEEANERASHPSYTTPRRMVFHDNAVFGVNGGEFLGTPWDAIGE